MTGQRNDRHLTPPTKDTPQTYTTHARSAATGHHVRPLQVIERPKSIDVHGAAALLLGSRGLRLHGGGGTLSGLVSSLACLHLPAASTKTKRRRLLRPMSMRWGQVQSGLAEHHWAWDKR